jgi:uncharacterized repeat protein (TIGR03843 family)
LSTSGQGVLELLRSGDVEVLGLLPYSSNYVFLTRVTGGDEELLAVYKPRKGERPLWDFPTGTLAAREVAAYEVSEAGGWGFVPPTVMRLDAPLGAGSLQQFIEHDPERHFFVLMEEPERRIEFAKLAAFDIVINNADRKGGHVLEDADGKLWAVDHGLAFNAEPKLRTVIWGFAGDELQPEARAQLETALQALADTRLDELLSPDEVIETRARAELLLKTGTYPHPSGPYAMPWPLV